MEMQAVHSELYFIYFFKFDIRLKIIFEKLILKFTGEK
jgi:hypothetical protein